MQYPLFSAAVKYIYCLISTYNYATWYNTNNTRKYYYKIQVFYTQVHIIQYIISIQYITYKYLTTVKIFIYYTIHYIP